MLSANYFSQNYETARARFLKAAGALGRGQSRSFQVPSTKDRNLTVDYFDLPPAAEKDTLLILTSGVHGTEGYTGSAIQTMFLQELAPMIPATCGLLLVHSLNPFGFKYNRRSTEANVNLNRNFGADAEHFQTENSGYEKLAALLEPQAPVGGTASTIAKAVQFVLRAMLQKGFNGETLNRSLAFGQFKHSRGLEFGGQTWEPQIADLIETLKTHFVGYRNIVIFDLHTGLGDRYELHLIPVEDPLSRDAELVAKLFDIPSEKNLYRWTDPSQPGFYETAGDFNSLPPKLKASDQKTLTLTFEFGTLGNGTSAKIDTLARLLAENEGYHAGYRSQAAEETAKARFAELFAPSEIKWRENAIDRSREVLKRVLNRLS